MILARYRINNCTLPRGRSIYLAVRVRGRVYTRPPTVSLLTLMGRLGTGMGVGEYQSLGGTRIVLVVAAVKGGNGGCCRVSTCLASINQWEWHPGEVLGKGDGEEGDACSWIERRSDCYPLSPWIGGMGGDETGSKTLLMNGVYDGPR